MPGVGLFSRNWGCLASYNPQNLQNHSNFETSQSSNYFWGLGWFLAPNGPESSISWSVSISTNNNVYHIFFHNAEFAGSSNICEYFEMWCMKGHQCDHFPSTSAPTPTIPQHPAHLMPASSLTSSPAHHLCPATSLQNTTGQVSLLQGGGQDTGVARRGGEGGLQACRWAGCWEYVGVCAEVEEKWSTLCPSCITFQIFTYIRGPATLHCEKIYGIHYYLLK